MIPDKLPDGERLTKMIAGKMKHPVTIRTEGPYHYLQTPFHLKDEVAAMKGAKWMGYDPIDPQKVWRVDNCRRNNFNIAYLEGMNPFTKYTKKLTDVEKAGFQIRKSRIDWHGNEIALYEHQCEMTLHMLIRKQCIISGEMGVGKSLSAFEAMELSLVPEIWYIGPKSAIASVKLEAMKWKLRAKVLYFTYEEMKKILQNWKVGMPPPKFVVFDESSRIKTPTSQRSQAAYYLAEQMREAYGDDCYIIEMSGSPAPKSPLDWYFQCEIACPGFIKEGDIHKFQRRLAFMVAQEDIVGTRFQRLVAWRDGNPDVCNTCGGRKLDLCHDIKENFIQEIDGIKVYKPEYHEFIQISNEVEKLYKRMSGLVLVKLKKDCLDLPDKVYREIKLKPSLDLLRAARLVTAGSRSAMEAMTLFRELSDGFQYKETLTKREECRACKLGRIQTTEGEIDCKLCSGTGAKTTFERDTIEVPSPKIDCLTELLNEEFEEVGRLVVYAGFTASIDRICTQVKKLNWEFIRVDGRGWYNSMNPNWDTLQCLQQFQDTKNDKRIVFVGHPGSAGMGITLTASPAIVYYSNDFNAESRIQSEDRIHRAGMDVNRGATIIDLLCLPTDKKILDNLRRKRELQSISIGELQHAIDTADYTS